VRLPEWAVDRVRLPVPRWVVRVFEPAQAYMERSKRRAPGSEPRHRPSRGVTSYAPLTSDGRLPQGWEKAARQPLPPEVKERIRRRADERAARTAEIFDSLGPLLDAAVEELQSRGTTIITVPPVVLFARIVKFRRGASVLEIDGRGEPGAGVTSGKRTRLRPQGAEEQAEILKRYIGDMLAGLTAGT
jgi:hypothetical protein